MLRYYFRPFRAETDSVIVPYAEAIGLKPFYNRHHGICILMAVADKYVVFLSIIWLGGTAVFHIPLDSAFYLLFYVLSFMFLVYLLSGLLCLLLFPVLILIKPLTLVVSAKS